MGETAVTSGQLLLLPFFYIALFNLLDFKTQEVRFSESGVMIHLKGG